MTIEEANPAQREAITTNARRVLVLAGPGSGKTATVTTRINRLLSEGVDPESIVVLTFTNAAARELERRITPPMPEEARVIFDALSGKQPPFRALRLGHCGTLHSFCLRLLREQGGFMGYGPRLSVISPDSAEELLASKATSLGVKRPLKDLLALKAKGRPARGTRLDPMSTAVAAYFDELKENGILDFDVILSEALELIRATNSLFNRWRHLVVDEVQDSSLLDWAIYDDLPIENKLFVGDPDQGIYSFRGGAVGASIAHAQDAETVVIKLESNYRSHEEICDTAQRLIEHNGNRIAKKTISEKGPGGSVETFTVTNEGEEIGRVAHKIHDLLTAGVAPKEIAVLARTNAIAGNFRKTLAASGLPVVQRDSSGLPRDWHFARAYVELCANPANDSLAFFYLTALARKSGQPEKDAVKLAHDIRRDAAARNTSINEIAIRIEPDAWASDVVQNAGKFGVSAESRMILAERLAELPFGARAVDLALELATVFESVKKSGDGIEVTTIHGSKGREWDAVFVVGVEDEVIPGKRYMRPIPGDIATQNAVEEERRLFYVAITRGRNNVFVSASTSRVTPWGAIETHNPSRFFFEIGGKR